MPILSANHPKALWPGVHEFFGIEYDKHEEQYSVIFEQEDSSKQWEEDVLTHGFGLAPIKREGEPLRMDTHSQGWTVRYTHIAYALGFIVTKEEIADNQYQKLANSRAGSLAFSMRQTKENVGANILNRFTNTSYLGGDGKALGVTDHPLKRGGTYANITTAATFSEASIEDLQILAMGAVNDDNLKISLMLDRLIVPRQLYYEADRILKSTLQADTANNARNALNATGAFPGGVHVNHYLTSSTAYFAISNCPNGLMCYNRAPYEFDRDNDFHTKNALASAYERYSMGWSNPRGCYANAGA